MKLMKPTSNWNQWSQNSPRNHWSQQSQEAKKSRSQEDQKPRRQEAKKPRSQEAKKPRSQEDKKTRSQEDKKTKRQENQQPTEASEKHIKNKKKNKKNCDKIIPNTSQPFAGLFLRWARVPEILPWGHFTWKVAGSLFMSRPDKICKTHECIIPLRKACRQQKGVEENWSTIWTAIRTQWGFVAPNIETPSLPGTAHHVRLDARSSC